MKNRFISLVMTLLMLAGSISYIPAGAQGVTIPDGVEEIEFNTTYWLEAGETAWYSFVAPAPQCYLTALPIRQLGEYWYGQAPAGHRYYDDEGNELGIISHTNDPDISEWTAFEVGRTYYLKVFGTAKEGTSYSLCPVIPEEPAVDATAEGGVTDTSCSLSAQGVSKFFDGETNTDWDIYTVTQSLRPGAHGHTYSTDFYLLPYRVYFCDSVITAGDRTIYGNITRSCADTAELIKSYTKLPSDIPTEGDEYIFGANHYSYIDGITDKEILTRTYKVYVPHGRRIVLGEDGCFRDTDVDDRFTDVPADSWYSDAVKWCTDNGYMVGSSDVTFAPDLNVSRAQLALVLANIDAADLSVYADTHSFTDVGAGAWYSTAVEWAYDMGITSGIGDGRFAPNRSITRQEMAVFLCKYAGHKGASLPEGAELTRFKDRGDIAPWAQDSMARIYASGLMLGTSETTLSPLGVATRSQIARVTQQLYLNLLQDIIPCTRNGSYFLEGDFCGYSYADELIALTGKENPHVLYIGMAGTDEGAGFSGVQSDFCGWRGCTADYLKTSDLGTGEDERKIRSADIIYVGGGSSVMLLGRLKRYGTDTYIRQAIAQGTVAGGSSAGAICFGAYGTSGVGDQWFINVAGVGGVDMIVCPHGEDSSRVDAMKQQLLDDPSIVGVAVANAAIEISGGKYRIYTEEGFHKKGMGVRYWSDNGVIKSEDINSMEWRPVSELIK